MIKKVNLMPILSFVLAVSIFMLSSSVTAVEDTTKMLTFQGKTLTASYTKTEKMSSYDKNDTLVYMTDDGDELGYDAVTGQLTYLRIEGLYGDPDKDPNLCISEEEAMAIADEFFAANCDMSKYTFLGCTYYEDSGDYMIDYGLLFQGYRTVEMMFIIITNSGEIRLFSYNPYVFDDVKPTPIDEQLLKKQLDVLVRDYSNSLVSYEVKWQRLLMDENNQLAMEFAVSVDLNFTYPNGETNILTAGIVYQIKVPDFTVSYGSDDGNLLVGFDYPNGENIVRIVCDMNNDNYVSTSDARSILRAAVSIDTLSEEDTVLADVNNDGKVSISDARTALRIAVGIQGFPFEFFFAPYTPPTNLDEFLDDYYAKLDNVTSIKGDSDFYSAPLIYKEISNVDNVNYIIDVLKNNIFSELIYGEQLIDRLQPPDVLWWGNPYNLIYLTFEDGTDEWGLSLVLGKDRDGNSWLWYTPSNWAAMLKNDKDAYDIIMGMINEE